MVKNPPAHMEHTGDLGLIPGSGRSSEGGNGKPLQYSCLENPLDRGACPRGHKQSDVTEMTEHAQQLKIMKIIRKHL